MLNPPNCFSFCESESNCKLSAGIQLRMINTLYISHIQNLHNQLSMTIIPWRPIPPHTTPPCSYPSCTTPFANHSLSLTTPYSYPSFPIYHSPLFHLSHSPYLSLYYPLSLTPYWWMPICMFACVSMPCSTMTTTTFTTTITNLSFSPSFIPPPFYLSCLPVCLCAYLPVLLAVHLSYHPFITTTTTTVQGRVNSVRKSLHGKPQPSTGIEVSKCAALHQINKQN